MCQPHSNPTNHRAQKTSALITDYLSRRGFLKASMSVAASPAMLGAAWNNVTTKVEARQSEPGLE
ncbi:MULTISPECIES: twin-arginine translocation signal domain-containing protein [unclassified Ruegeria]|uniref:twin-arginine translocation signal domain-containing protein n=1 Tax=unclassified Ruegeria TaxID=2625375 RepID=UPI0020A09F1F|nr:MULTISPECIES: twin-arginine translocation signal domain-containing protein [unclassified Ruegeria]